MTFLSSAAVSPHFCARIFVRLCCPATPSPRNCSSRLPLCSWQNQKNAFDGFFGALESTSFFRRLDCELFAELFGVLLAGLVAGELVEVVGGTGEERWGLLDGGGSCWLLLALVGCEARVGW